MRLGGDAHKFINLFISCWNEITLGYIENINSLLNEVDTEQSSSEANTFLSVGQRTQMRSNNFFLRMEDTQIQTVTELLKIVKTVIDKSVFPEYNKLNLLNDYNDSLKKKHLVCRTRVFN